MRTPESARGRIPEAGVIGSVAVYISSYLLGKYTLRALVSNIITQFIKTHYFEFAHVMTFSSYIEWDILGTS
jgi:hypothetical protein